MKKYLIIFFIILILSTSLYALVIPFSENELKTPNNHLSGFVRISPDDSLACPLATDVWLWHNGENLYLLWEAETDKKFKKGNFAPNDNWVDADFLRFNNYESGNQTMYIGFFSNFRWEFKPECNLYLGYKTAHNEIDKKFETDYKLTEMLH